MTRTLQLLFKICCALPGSGARSLQNRLRVFFLRRLAPAVGTDCVVMPGVLINKPSNLFLGSRSGIGYRCIISCFDKVEIGDRVMMGTDVIVITSNHVWSPMHRTYADQGLVTAPVSIGDDSWIGSRSIILPGVRLGKGVTVAAGAVVSRDVPDYATVGGVPARVLNIKETIPSKDDAG